MNSVDPMPDPETNLVANAEPSGRRVLRRAFYVSVLNASSSEPKEDLRHLCRAWLKLTGAAWIWLWLQHKGSETRPWELTAVFGSDGNTEEYLPEENKNVAIEYPDSVAEYVALLQRPVFVTGLDAWQRPAKEPQYRVRCLSELSRLKCQSFLGIPLLFHPQENSKSVLPYSEIENIRGLLCAHFTTKEPAIMPLQHEESYTLMGYATSNAIKASFTAEQHRILFELDSLATRFLNKTGKVTEERKQYLGKVIQLIKKHLQIEHVSVFFQAPHDDECIECIGTTGLFSHAGRVADSEISLATYKKGENITGTVYKTGVPFISSLGKPIARSEKTYKYTERQDNLPESDCAWACYPIKLPEIDPADPKTSMTVGVLRCDGNNSMLATSRQIPRNFDPIQVQTLDFITRQIAPVLETMAIQIAREHKINIIKHDLAGPINTIERQTYQVADCLERRSPLPKYWLPNIECAVLLARNLAGGLTEKQNYNPVPTAMEGDIVAHLLSGLRYYAAEENAMRLDYVNVRNVFPKLNIDRALIERALTNLLLNAIKYGYSDTDITIEGERAEDCFLLHVKNFGIGVKPHEKDRIFQGEYRSPDVISEYMGLGLGLKIARAAMRRHGGDLILKRLTTPTVFTMIFPKHLATNANERD